MNYIGVSIDASSDGLLGMPADYISDPYTWLNANAVNAYGGFTTPRRALMRPFGSAARLCFLMKEDGGTIQPGEKYIFPASESMARDLLPAGFLPSFWKWVVSRINLGEDIFLYIGCPGFDDPRLCSTYGKKWYSRCDPNTIKRASLGYRKARIQYAYDGISVSSTRELSAATAALNAEVASWNYGLPFVEPTVRASYYSRATRSGFFNYCASYGRWYAGEIDGNPDPLPKFGAVGSINCQFITGADDSSEPGRLAKCQVMRDLAFSRRGNYNDMIIVTGLTGQPVGPGW